MSKKVTKKEDKKVTKKDEKPVKVDKKVNNKEETDKTDKKKDEKKVLSAKEKEKLIEKIKKDHKNDKFYCVGERKRDVCVTCITDVDISRNPYRISGNCVSCNNKICKFISSK
tara:strand:+ start:1591 stop:1929 length:339 start_codon:yes stop_codon:yes gene_type:complete